MNPETVVTMLCGLAILVGVAGTVIPVLPGSILVGLWSVATLLPTLAVMVRRLRDVGYDWKNVFWLLVPIAGLIVLALYLSKPSNDAPSAPAAG